MAYKYTTGSVNRGDIYAESSIDDDGNTYINFGNNSIGLVAGAVDLLTVVSASQTKVHFNDGGVDCDFIVESPSQSLALYLHAENEVFHINHGESNFKTKIHSTHGEAMTVHQNGVVFNDDGHATNDLRVESDTNTHMIFVDASSNEVGIGTSSPNSVFHVSGSQAGNYAQIATSTATLDASHYIVDYTGNGNATITLPTVSGIAGRVYHILCNAQGGSDVLHIACNGSETIVGAQVQGAPVNIGITGSNTPQSVTIVSTGARWQILHDGRSQEENGG